MNAYTNYTAFIEWNRLNLQIKTFTARKEDPELIEIIQREQDLVFMTMDTETQREMVELEQLRKIEARLDMLPSQFCPYCVDEYHTIGIKMIPTGEQTFTQDSQGNITGAYSVLRCPHCGNAEAEGVRT